MPQAQYILTTVPINYLVIAHSMLRPKKSGPEREARVLLLVLSPPQAVNGDSMVKLGLNEKSDHRPWAGIFDKKVIDGVQSNRYS